MIADHPFEIGGVKAIEACVFHAVTIPITGASGRIAEVADAVILGLLTPLKLTAKILKSYEVPFVSPVTGVEVIVGVSESLKICQLAGSSGALVSLYSIL